MLTIQTVNPPRSRAPESQIYAHGITRDEALKLETGVVDLSGRPTYRSSGRFPGIFDRIKDTIRPPSKPRLLSENEFHDEDDVEYGRPVYPDRVTFEGEVAAATKAHANAEKVVQELVADFQADRAPELKKADEAVGWMAEFITRNPDALM